MKRTRAALLLKHLALSCALYSCAFASAKRTTFTELSQSADAIVVATCTGATSDWNFSHSLIFTKYTFTVTRVIKGDAGLQSFEFRHIGGQVGNEVMDVVHAPQFTPGVTYVLFLSEPKNTGALITKEEKASGQWQRPRLLARAEHGIYEIAVEQNGGSRYVLNPPEETQTPSTKGYAQRIQDLERERVQPAGGNRKLSIDEFVILIHRMMK